MGKKDNMYIANLGFLLNYDEGRTPDEIEYEIFKVAWQQRETIHYDRSIGGGFPDLEQEPANIATAMKFSANMMESIYIVNAEKSFDPYIVMGFNDIEVLNDGTKSGEYLVNMKYKLLQDLVNTKGEVNI